MGQKRKKVLFITCLLIKWGRIQLLWNCFLSFLIGNVCDCEIKICRKITATRTRIKLVFRGSIQIVRDDCVMSDTSQKGSSTSLKLDMGTRQQWVLSFFLNYRFVFVVVFSFMGTQNIISSFLIQDSSTKAIFTLRFDIWGIFSLTFIHQSHF